MTLVTPTPTGPSSRPFAVLFQPTAALREALLGEDRFGGRPPVLRLDGDCPSPGRIPWAGGLPRRPGSCAIVLLWGGRVFPEGVDRIVRSARAWPIYAVYMLAEAEAIARAAEKNARGRAIILADAPSLLGKGASSLTAESPRARWVAAIRAAWPAKAPGKKEEKADEASFTFLAEALGVSWETIEAAASHYDFPRDWTGQAPTGILRHGDFAVVGGARKAVGKAR